MSFLKNLFAGDASDSVVEIGGYSIKELSAIKNKYQPNAEYTQSFRVRIEEIDKEHILDLIKNGFDVKATMKFGNPFIFYSKDQATFDIMVYFGADPDIDHVNFNDLKVIDMSAFIWDRYWEKLKRYIISPTNRFADPITKVVDMSKFDLLLSKGFNIDDLPKIGYRESSNYVYSMIFNYIWFGGDAHYRNALDFIAKVKPDLNRRVAKNCYGVSINVSYKLYYFLDIFRVANKREISELFVRFEKLFGSFDFGLKLDMNSNLFFLNALNQKEDEIKYIEFLISHHVDPFELNSDGTSFYSWIMNNKKGRKKLVDVLEKLEHTKTQEVSTPKVSSQIAVLQKPLPQKKNANVYDGFFFLELLQNDIIYFHEEDILYQDGEHRVFNSWFNQTEVYKYPEILKDGQRIQQQLINFCLYVESNPNLTIPASEIGKDLLAHFYGENLTGILAINLFADHFLKVTRPNEEKRNSLLVLVETRIINSIPNYKHYLNEFFRTVIDYNPLNQDNLEIIDMSFSNWNVGQPKKKKRPQPKKQAFDEDYFDSLIQAMVINQDMDQFQMLLRGKDINQIHAANHVTLLHIACQQNLVDFACYLIENSANVNALTTKKSTTADQPYSLPVENVSPLQLACQHPDTPLIRKLLDAGADANQANHYMFTPLMKAAQKDNTDGIRALIDHGANIEAVNFEGGTPLYFAAEENASKAAKLLIEYGANVNVQTTHFATPIAFFITHANTSMVKTLLNHGATFDYERKLMGTNKMTGLVSMIVNEHYSTEMVEFLIEHDYPISTFVNGLHIAVILELYKMPKEAQSIAKYLAYDYSNVALFTGDTEPSIADEKAIGKLIKEQDYDGLRDFYIRKKISLNNFKLLLKGTSQITGINQNVTPELRERLNAFFNFYKRNGATLDMIVDIEKDRKTFLLYLMSQFFEKSPTFSNDWLVAIIESLMNNGCNVNASDGKSTPLDLARVIQNKSLQTQLEQLLLSKGAQTYNEYYLAS